jgi:chemotaxis family two-component system sensor kinase Cph1
MIKAILRLSRVGTRGKDFKETDMNIILRRVKENLKILIEEKKANISINPLPVINADEDQMIQLFQNLLSNSLKFQGPLSPKIVIDAKRNNKEWIFSVKDNGIGIDKKNYERIFLMFQRLHKKDEYEGTGMGLTICKKIVERHRGKIWLNSELGNGSTFYFSVPFNNITMNN